ncbi:armadillo repeat-containing 4 [Olea europaea subsp. europaea]|uniref:Armadillo repeat-containing 4 n=1 Tax=Olea europaea subsp. europaea TaxID=158383 RepID=A0A8S0Q4L1_OLEEU|nr:armadillo repeat-containing 4 [Olea europaea subsp. europaea]
MQISAIEEQKQAENINWDEAFHRYANVIAHENDALRVKVTIKLARMCNHVPENILSRTVPILVELLESPSRNLSPPVQEASAYCLKCIACKGEGQLAILIGQSGAIPILLRLLLNSDGSFQKGLLKCLRNAVTFGEPNRLIVASNGGTEIVLKMLDSCSDDSMLILLEILSALALKREVRKLILNSGGVWFLVESARLGSLISRSRAAQAIGLLGLIKRARRELVNAGAIPVLMELIIDRDMSMKLAAANALGVILTDADNIWPIAESGVVPLYTELLGSSDPIGREIAGDVLYTLATVGENAFAIVKHLSGILTGDNDEAKSVAVDILRHLLNCHKHFLPFLSRSPFWQALVIR